MEKMLFFVSEKGVDAVKISDFSKVALNIVVPYNMKN